jgi:hypothetical protein
MAKLSPNLQHLTNELPANKRAEVEEAIASSPYLRQIMTEAVNAGSLKHVHMGEPGANEGGHYDFDKKAIFLSPNTFKNIKSEQDLLDALTDTLGHETGHALNAEQSRTSLNFTSYAITEELRAAGPGGEFDATQLAGVYLRNARRDEAMAEIHGWNALASRIEHIKGVPPTRDDMLERIDSSTNCVNEVKGIRRLAPGILLAPDMQMSDTRLPKAGPVNLEPVAQCHFDQSRKVLGAEGAANYTNYYGAYLMQDIASNLPDWSNPPRIKLDLASLGLDKTQMESTGLALGDQGLTIVDNSRGLYKPIVLRGGGGLHGTPDAESETTSRAAPNQAQSPQSAPSITDTAHIAHSGWRDARRGLAELEGPQWDARGGAEQDRRAAALFAGSLQQDTTFTGIDRVLPSEKTDPRTGQPLGVIAMQGPSDADWHRRALLTDDVLGTMSLGDASRSSEKHMQSWQETQAQDLKRSLEQSQDQGGMTRSIGARTLSGSQSADANSGG